MEKNILNSKTFEGINPPIPAINEFINTHSSLNYWEFSNYMVAIQFLEEKGLILKLDKGYVKRGNIGVVDPITGRVFAITHTGYIRTYKISHWGRRDNYQLNPRNPLYGPIGYLESRILFPKQYYYMATLLWKSILRIRKAAGK